MRSFILSFLLFIFSFFSQSAFSAVTWSSSQFQLYGYKSLPELCTALVPRVSSSWGQSVTYSSHLVRTTDGKCTFRTPSGGFGDVWVSKDGSVCDLPTETYNPQTGSCDAPQPDQCEPTIGQFIYHEFAFSFIGADSNPSQDPPITVCKNLCQYSHTFDGFSTPPKRDFTPPDKILGSFKYKGNGTSCTPSASNPSVFDQPPSKDPVTTPPEYNQDVSCDNWTTNPDGTLTRSCTSKTEFKEPGTFDCTGLTAAHCKPSKPAPEYIKTDTVETTKQTTNPDGSKKTDTTTSKDTVVCKGSKPCTTSSSETTESTTTKPDGTEGDKTSECKGTACAKPDPTPGMPEDEVEEEEAPSSVSGGATCEVQPTCEGDAIQCAILKQQFEARCDFEESADFEGSKSDIESLFDGEKFELDSVDIQAPSFINSGVRFLPASCPPPQQISLSSNGGHTYSLSFEPLCSFASDFSFLIMTMMGIWCAVYVGRAFGGE